MRTFIRNAPATIVLIGLIFTVWVVAWAETGDASNTYLGSKLARFMIFWAPISAGEEYGLYRAFTAIFLHLDVGHVLANSIMLLVLGVITERYLGWALYTATFVVTGFASFVVIMWMDPLSPTAGASGALYALMVVMIAVVARTKSQSLRAPIIVVVINVVYTFIADGISLWGHLGGLAAGLLIAWPVTSRNNVVAWGSVIVLAVVSVAGALVGQDMLLNNPQTPAVLW